MPTRLDTFNFEHRLFRQMEHLSSLSESLPVHPLVAKPKHFATLRLDEPDNNSIYENVSEDPWQDSSANDLTQTASHRITCPAGDIWIQGNTLLCACPDCHAPMTIRIWLQLADCWRCESSIELSEQQIAAVEQLTEMKSPARKIAEAKTAFTESPARDSRQTKVETRRLPVPSPVLLPALDSRHDELEKLTRTSRVADLVRRGWHVTPAWLVSFLVHLIAILVLAFIVLRKGDQLAPTITLSTFLDSSREPGGQIRIENPLDLLQDDLEIASQLDPGDSEIRDVIEQANQDARELVVDPRPTAALPDMFQVKQNITMRPDQRMSFAARDPRVRAEMVQNEGGTLITEAAVARGLRWLASVQNQDGSWSLANYEKHERPNNKGDIMGTSLALLPMLGAGQTHEYGIYKQTVAAGLAWLIDHQETNGDLRAGFAGQAGMYAHGQATIVLCEALAMSGDQRLHLPAQRAIKFIEFAQHGKGGWRYTPGQPGDTSVVGWQMMALQSARSANMNLDVDESTLKLADYFLDTVAAPAKFDDRNETPLPDGAAYCYQPGRPATPTMTAEAILCRMYLGWQKQDPRLSAAIKWLINDHLPSEKEKNLYYWYYGTQVMHHYGGKPWTTWNDKMRELLISTQESRGRYPGSWNPAEFEWGNRGGRIYTTSLAVCTLEVYYRHLPLFKQIELE